MDMQARKTSKSSRHKIDRVGENTFFLKYKIQNTFGKRQHTKYKIENTFVKMPKYKILFKYLPKIQNTKYCI